MKLAVKKLRTILILPLLLLSTFAVIGGLSVHRAYATTQISILPSVIDDNTLTPGSTFQYFVSVTGLDTSLYASQYDFLYDPSVIQAQNVDPGYWSPLVSGGFAFCITTLDNTHGDVSVACTSIGAGQSSTPTSISLGIITFQVMALGLTTQNLSNVIFLHSLGGGSFSNIPVVVGPSATFTNEGFFAMADFPSADNLFTGTAHRQAWPEKVRWSFSGDTAFTAHLLDLFGNVNSTGNVPALSYVKFVLTSKDFGTFTIFSNKVQVDAGTVYAIPLDGLWSPLNSQGVLMVGKWHITAQVFFQAVFPDGSLGQLQAGATIKEFHVQILP